MNYATSYPRFWLWYFVGSVLLTILNSVYSIGKISGGASGSSVFGFVLGWIGLLPLYGYARQRRVNPRWLWLAIFAISALGTILLALIMLYTAWARTSLLPVGYMLPFLVLGLPYIFSLHQYVFRSPHIWPAF